MAEATSIELPVEGQPEGEPKAEPKKKGKPKDPSAPKRPKSGYGQFTEKRRPELKEQEPALASDLSAFGKRLAEEWGLVPQEDKDRMQAKYDGEMKIWKPIMAEYKKTPGYKAFVDIKTDWQDKRNLKKLNKTMNKDAPKRPKSGYMMFTGEIREATMEHCREKGLGMGDAARIMSEKWGAVAETEKARYGEVSQGLKVEYDIKFLEYRKSDAFKTYQNAKNKLEAKQALLKLNRTHLDEAPARPPSAYAIFRSEKMPGMVDENEKRAKDDQLSVQQIGKQLSALWVGLDQPAKTKYQEEAERLKEEYEQKLEEFKAAQKYGQFLEKRVKVKARENTLVNLRDLPKRPKSVFALFADDHKDQVPAGKGEGKGRHALKTKWVSAETDKKQLYESKEKELKINWMEAVEEFKQTESYKLFENTKKKIEIEFSAEATKVTTIRFLKSAPNPPPKTPFAVYLIEKRKREGTIGKSNKKARVEEVKNAQREWLKLEKPVKNEYDTKRKDLIKEFEQSAKEYMESEKWKEYVKEAKRMKIPVQALLMNKKAVIKKINGVISPDSIPIPKKPDLWPEKPKSAMQLFSKEKRGEGLDVIKINDMWKEMDPEEKKKYTQIEADDKKAFEEGMREFKSSSEGKAYFRDLQNALTKKSVLGAKIKFLKDLPKKPKAAVHIFMARALPEIKKENPSLKGFEVRKRLEEKWTILGTEGQSVYQAEQKSLQNKFDSDMADFKKSDNWKGYVKATTFRSGGMKVKSKGKAKAKAPAGPRPPPSQPKKPADAITALGQEQGLKPIDAQKAFAALPEDDRNERNEAVRQRTAEYHEKLTAWKNGPDGKRYQKMCEAVAKKMRIVTAKKRLLKSEPKKPQTAFSIFSSVRRPQVTQEHPQMALPDIGKKLAEDWEKLGEDEKAEYTEKEKNQAEEYEKAMELYKKSGAYRAYETLTKRVAAVVPGPVRPANFPKKPLHAMMMFGKQHGGNLVKQRDAWLKLGAEGQKEWQDKYKEAEAQYQTDLDNFNKSIDGKKYTREVSAFSKKQKLVQAKSKFLGGKSELQEPKKPLSSYFIFVADKRAGLIEKGVALPEVAKEITKLWQGLDTTAKKEYDDKAIVLKKEYTDEMAKYRNSANYKAYLRACNSISGVGARKAQAKAKAKVKAKVQKNKAKAKAKARGAPAAKKAADSDSDVMGSDSDSSSSSADSDSD